MEDPFIRSAFLLPLFLDRFFRFAPTRPMIRCIVDDASLRLRRLLAIPAIYLDLEVVLSTILRVISPPSQRFLGRPFGVSGMDDFWCDYRPRWLYR